MKTLVRSTMNYFIPRRFWYGLYLYNIVGRFLRSWPASPCREEASGGNSRRPGVYEHNDDGDGVCLTAASRKPRPLRHRHRLLLPQVCRLVICGIIVVHPAIIFLTHPATIALLETGDDTAEPKAGIISALAVVSLSTVTVLRRRFKHQVRWLGGKTGAPKFNRSAPRTYGVWVKI